MKDTIWRLGRDISTYLYVEPASHLVEIIVTNSGLHSLTGFLALPSQSGNAREHPCSG